MPLNNTPEEHLNDAPLIWWGAMRAHLGREGRGGEGAQVKGKRRQLWRRLRKDGVQKEREREILRVRKGEGKGGKGRR